MKIDLEKVIAYSEDSLQNRAIMRNIMLDLYPDCTREMNILLAVYESGIPREIKKNQKIDDNEYSMYVSSIINDYGIDEQLIIEALDAWIDVCIAKGASTHINKPIISHNNKDRISDVYNHPIEHVPINTNTVMIGDDADYEIRTVYGENVEILQYLGLEDEYLVIPSKIGGKNVIGIAKDAFKGFKTLRKINISEGVQYIENGAFAECSLLEEVMLPSTINRIGTEPVMEVTKDNEAEKGAFFKTSIKNIKLPNGLKSLGDFSFYNCIMLESILLPADLVKIGSFAFCNCTSLKSIDLPNGILRINNSTFKNCSSLKKVLLSDNLKTIGNNAFSSTGLCEVQLPSSVKEIEREVLIR